VPKYVALLRGINVGGLNPLPMAGLRALFGSLGYTDVTTLIQSGNVVFTAPKAVTPAGLERAIAAEFGLDITVVVRTANELAKAVKANPFGSADPSTLHLGFMAANPAAAAVAAVTKIDAGRFEPDEFAIRGCDLYLHLPNGMGRAKLPGYLDRQLKVPTTVRNWNTVAKLIGLAGLP
jgi:uncharacterized protein (DUF1697 family)